MAVVVTVMCAPAVLSSIQGARLGLRSKSLLVQHVVVVHRHVADRAPCGVWEKVEALESAVYGVRE